MEYFRIGEGGYREGIGSMLEVIDGQRAYVTAEKNHIGALANYKIALTLLERTMGSTTLPPLRLLT